MYNCTTVVTGALLSESLSGFRAKLERVRKLTATCGGAIRPTLSSSRDQREWVFEVREVKSENKNLSLFFEHKGFIIPKVSKKFSKKYSKK